MRTIVSALIFALSTCASAHAALYEFTITARVFNSIFPHPAIGEDVTVRYVADSGDIEPTVGLGRYPATSATISFPGGMYLPVEIGTASLAVILGSGTGGDTVGYGARVRIPGHPTLDMCPLVMTLDFPRGSFEDESLPLSLPLSNAGFTLLEVFPALGIELRIFSARVASYSAVQVPEPAWAGALILAGTILRPLRCRTLNRQY